MNSPTCDQNDHFIEQHGQKRNDPFHWLRDKNWKKIVEGSLKFDNPKILDYINEENAYTKEVMKEHKSLEQKIYAEILGRIDENLETYPVQKGDYYYFDREKEGLNYPIFCRFHKNSVKNTEKSGHTSNSNRFYDYADEKASSEVYFDVNEYAKGHELFSLRNVEVNKTNTLLAYMYNLSGSLECSLKIKDLETGTDFTWQIDDLTGSFEWISPHEICYIERDEHSRGKKIYTMDVRKGPESSQLIFEKPDEFDNYYASLYTTTDESHLCLNLSSGGSQAVFIKELDKGSFVKFSSSQDDIEYFVEHYKGDFYIHTNEQAPDYRVMRVKKQEHTADNRENWQVFLEEDPGNYIKSFSIYKDKMVLERSNNKKALPEIAVLSIDAVGSHSSKSSDLNIIAMPDAAYTLSFHGDWDSQSTKLRLSYSTPIFAEKVLELDTNSCTVRPIYEYTTPNYDPSLYTVKREFAAARDGELIPVTICHRKDLKLDGSNPAFVYSYGAYGHGLPARFSSSNVSLMERGFVCVRAHIRGGDDKGHEWYLDGKMHSKLNTFYDFIDSCEHLIKKSYTHAGNIAINGGSAGGLLMGAVTNMRPDLFRCVVSDVSFVDVVNTISDPSLPLTPPEWEEWGNPIESSEDFKYMMSYSPYDNVSAQNYPATLYNSGISDEQVTYWEPTKMVAKLRSYKTDDNDLLLNMKMHAGHAGASKKYEQISEIAFNFCFILKQFEKP